MIYVVRRPFKAGGNFYPAGEIIDNPAGIRLFKIRLNDGHIIAVTEQTVDDWANYLQARYGVDVKEKLLNALKEKVEEQKEQQEEQSQDKERVEKVKKLAAKYNIQIEGRPLEEVIAEIKEKYAKSPK